MFWGLHMLICFVIIQIEKRENVFSIVSDTIQSIEGMDQGLSFMKRIARGQTIKIQQCGKIFIYFVSFWRHGRVVRRGIANPFSPVQIWVSPDQQKTRNPFFSSVRLI